MRLSLVLIFTVAVCVASQNEEQLLLEYSKEGNLDGIRKLIKNGVDVNWQNRTISAIHEAATYGQTDAVDILIANGANVSAVIYDRLTPLHLAAKNGHKDVARMLIKHGADVNAKNNEWSTPLHLACRGSWNDSADILLTLIELGANMSALEHGMWTPLHVASDYGNLNKVKILLEHGANINARDEGLERPIFYATVGGWTHVVRFLLEHGSILDSNLLYFAVRRKHKDVVRLLIQNGADLNETRSGITLLQYAVFHEYYDIAEILREAEESRKRNPFSKFVRKIFRKLFGSKKDF